MQIVRVGFRARHRTGNWECLPITYYIDMIESMNETIGSEVAGHHILVGPVNRCKVIICIVIRYYYRINAQVRYRVLGFC